MNDDNIIDFEKALKAKKEKENKEFNERYFKHVFESTDHLFKEYKKDENNP